MNFYDSDAWYGSGKRFPFADGYTVTFRQPKATHSHCNQLHGYSIQTDVEFKSRSLDALNWVVDFGGLKPFKNYLKENFDHTTAIAENDPHLDIFRDLDDKQVIDLRVFPAVGMEAFSRMFFLKIKYMLESGEFIRNADMKIRETPVYVTKVTVWEHPNNYAFYEEVPNERSKHK